MPLLVSHQENVSMGRRFDIVGEPQQEQPPRVTRFFGYLILAVYATEVKSEIQKAKHRSFRLSVEHRE